MMRNYQGFRKWYQYLLVVFCVLTFVVDRAQGKTNDDGKPALIPLPQSVKWASADFQLNTCKAIVINNESLRGEAIALTQVLHSLGYMVRVENKPIPANHIELKLGHVTAALLSDEAYKLEVRKDGITIEADTAHGIFNGLQTLYQLMLNNSAVKGCVIYDHPAFSWRGYMVDVGRNYQSVGLLKKQIDAMARYKLNVFHFHLTEDISWRLQIKQYPQLTAETNMLRNKGRFYTIEEVKDLIRYCRERYITLVPEIDMPGHSAAFRRVMGTDMQSEKGNQIVSNIINEVCDTYDVPYIHIGADEVRITNRDFLPGIGKLITRLGKTAIGWAPGGNYDKNTIRELWKDNGNKADSNVRVKYIDSRMLYLSDMEPLSCVVSIFNRELGGKLKGDSCLLGAEICLWNDRRVENENDLIKMNPVYPAIATFGERSWRGGGYQEINFAIGADTSARSKAFTAFEKRLLQHKNKYFRQEIFPYVKQTHVKWKLFGPFKNDGHLDTAFWPEQRRVNLKDSAAVLRATGATIWLWQTNWPMAAGWLKTPGQYTTWYAYTQLFSPADKILEVWIGLKDLSRSGADATPAAGEWDQNKSKVYVNSHLIDPPHWAFAGREKGKLEDPLADEGFYYREPFKIRVKKGWNTVLIKLPMGGFNHQDWQVPPKWMFTFVPVHKSSGINWDADDFYFNPD
ncbi:family 20 glycosylhydrolase [Mucilaginibacter sp. AW1-3]